MRDDGLRLVVVDENLPVQNSFLSVSGGKKSESNNDSLTAFVDSKRNGCFK